MGCFWCLWFGGDRADAPGGMGCKKTTRSVRESCRIGSSRAMKGYCKVESAVGFGGGFLWANAESSLSSKNSHQARSIFRSPAKITLRARPQLSRESGLWLVLVGGVGRGLGRVRQARQTAASLSRHGTSSGAPPHAKFQQTRRQRARACAWQQPKAEHRAREQLSAGRVPSHGAATC